jgi:pyruvate dehydrogenase E1 component alpha subunit
MSERNGLLQRSGAQWLQMMIAVRAFEEALGDLFRKGSAVLGAVHLSIGQEAVAVGVSSTLLDGDQVTVSHRGHGVMLARGLDAERMYAEILGRATGYCGGKGGSMHIASPALGVAGANGIVGGGIPIALGLAQAAKQLGTGRVGVAVFGDGAANVGPLYETLNLGAIWRAPLVLVCENNGYTEFTPVDDITAGPGIHRRAEGFGVPGMLVDGDDVVAVHEAMATACQRARRGDGPTLIECRTTRMRGHHEGEERYAGVYREGPTGVTDPIARLAGELDAAGLGGTDLSARLGVEERERMDGALAAALTAPAPEPHSAFQDVFAP